MPDPVPKRCEDRDPAAVAAAVARIRSLVDKHCGAGRLLDAGGGDGRILAGSGSVVLDLDQGLLRTARAAGAPVAIGDMQALPFQGRTFDSVILCHSIEHCPDTARVLAEIERALRPGGHLVIVAPNAAGLRQMQNLLAGEVRPSGNRPADVPQHQHQYTLPLLRRLLGSLPWAEIREVRGDVVSFPLMRTLRLRWLGRALAWLCPRLSDALIAVLRKRSDT